jgi:LysM repeat protein
MNILRTLFIIIIVLFNTNIVFSQTKKNNLKKSEKVETIDGEKFYLHTVEKGHTIYSICKLYEINSEELTSNNPNIIDGLKQGQELKIPHKEMVSESDDFIYHSVKKSETAYFISKKYGITLDKFFILNPDAKNGLKVGEKLKITKKPIQKEQIKKDTVIENNSKSDIKGNYLKHKVKKKETLYSISKLYNTSTEEILKANPLVRKNGLQKDNIINIPTKEFIVEITKDIVNTDTLKIENDSIVDCILSEVYDSTRTIKVGLLLPFELDIKSLNLEIENNDKLNCDALPKTKPFFEFYQGLLLNLKELKQNNIAVDLYVYNTKKEAATAKNIILKPEIKQLDFIIGPIYKNIFDTVLLYLPKNIPIINPLVDVSNSKNMSNIIIQNKTSDEFIYNEIIRYISNFENANYVILHNGSKNELNLIAKYKNIFFNSIEAKDTAFVTSIDFKNGKLAAIKNSIVKNRTNIIVIPSTDEAFVTNAITNLHVASAKDSVILIGVEEWLKYNIEVKYYHSLNLTIFKNRFVDYNSEEVNKFEQDFIDEYGNAPSIYSFVGYDTFNYYTKAFMSLGDNFSNCLNIYSKKGLSKKFIFEKIENKFINKYINIVQYKKDLTIHLIDN